MDNQLGVSVQVNLVLHKMHLTRRLAPLYVGHNPSRLARLPNKMNIAIAEVDRCDRSSFRRPCAP